MSAQTRPPLAELPLKAPSLATSSSNSNASSSSSSRRASPTKPTPASPSKLRALMSSPRTLRLLPSPFMAGASTPLSESTRASPSLARRSFALDEEMEAAPTELPNTPPRRLLDAFLACAGSASRSRTGSPSSKEAPPSSPFGWSAAEDVPAEAPTWTFYEDPEDATPISVAVSESNEDNAEPDEPKENTRPSPRRSRPTSLLSLPLLPSPSFTVPAPVQQDPEPSPPTTPTLTSALMEDANGEGFFGEGISTFDSPSQLRKKRKSGDLEEPWLEDGDDTSSAKRQRLDFV